MRLQTKLFALRLPVDLLEKLNSNHKNKGVSKTFQIATALKQYFKVTETN